MKAAVLFGNNDHRYEEIDEQVLKNDEVKIKVAYTGICGSDIHKMSSNYKYGFPAVMGHEISGTVSDVGDDVDSKLLGKNVVVVPFLPCYKCHYCESGLYSLCDDYKMIGSHFFGGFSEYVNVPVSNIIDIEEIPLNIAAMIEPLSISAHGVLNTKVDIGDKIVIFGAGTIGMFVAELLMIKGITNIIMVDINDEKLEFAKKRGIKYTINSIKKDVKEEVFKLTDNYGADVVFECAGSKITQEQSFLVAKKRGFVSFLGISYQDVLLKEEAFENIFRRELTIKGHWNSYSAPFPGREWLASIELLKENKLDLKDYISHTIELKDLHNTFQKILNRELTYNKILVKP